MKSAQLLVASVIAALLLVGANAFAQPAPIAAPMIAPKPALAPFDEANWRAIYVNDVPPSLIAWQLDPQHNTMPAYFNVPYSPLTKLAADYKPPKLDEKRVKGPFDLPDNIRLAASDEQKLLFAAGDNVAQLRELVSLLDQPLRTIEIEAQFVELPAVELKQFGIATGAATPGTPGVAAPMPGAFQVGFARSDFQKRLDELVAAGQARVISTQPQRIINNTGLAISLLSGPLDNTGANQNKRPAAPINGTDTIFTVTPTINGDDSISVLMNTTTLLGNNEQPGLLTIANLRGGQTIAMTGLSSLTFPRKIPMLGDIPIGMGLFRSKKPGDERAILVFVTAHVVRDEEK